MLYFLDDQEDSLLKKELVQSDPREYSDDVTTQNDKNSLKSDIKTGKSISNFFKVMNLFITLCFSKRLLYLV